MKGQIITRDGKGVGEVFVNLAVSFTVSRYSYEEEFLILGSFLGRKPLLEALWKSFCNGGYSLCSLKIEDGGEEASIVPCSVGSKPHGLAPVALKPVEGHVFELFLASKRFLAPWEFYEMHPESLRSGVEVFSFGETEEQMLERLFKVVDKMTTFPLTRDWARDLADFLKTEDSSYYKLKQVQVRGNHRDCKLFSHVHLSTHALSFDDLVSEFLERKFGRRD